MTKYPISFLIIISLGFLILPNFSVYGETFRLEIDDQVYDVEYYLDGNVIAMDIDKETISLLIATENVRDSEFQISLPNDLIRAENNEFAVLINGFEVGYEVITTVDSKLAFFIPEYTEEIEIIGTYVVPEFPLGSMIVLGTIVGMILIIQKSKKFLSK